MPRPSVSVSLSLVVATTLVLACTGPAGAPTSSPPSSLAPSPSTAATQAATQAAPTLLPTATAPSGSVEPSLPPDAWPVVPEPPVADAAGALLVMHVRWGDTGGAAPLLVVLADGRVVLQHELADGSGWGLSKRSLTASGLELVRGALEDVGLFDRDRTRRLIKPLNCCGAGDQLRVRLGDETVRVGRVLAYPENYEPSAAWDRFDALVEKLTDLDAWLPADAWADRAWGPYHAPRFCLAVSEDSPGGTGLDIDAVTWPEGVRPFERFGQEGWSSDTRVGFVDSATAYGLASSIVTAANAAAIPNDGSYGVPLEAGGDFRFPTIHDGATDWAVSLHPLTPHWQECQ